MLSEPIPQAPEHLHTSPPLRSLPIRFTTLARFPFLALIRLYQLTLSRILPENSCRFYPTCSHYGYQSIYKYGILKGGWMAIWRVLRCNPFNPGGFDPVPDKFSFSKGIPKSETIERNDEN